MNLYEIDNAIAALVDPETGELMDYEAFAQLSMERDQKIENMALVYKNAKATADAIKSEITALTERKQRAERTMERMKEYLNYALGGQKFESAKCAVNFRKTTSVNIPDVAQAIRWAEGSGHDECVRYKMPEINKTEIGKLLKAGIEVPCAELVEGLSVGVK